MISIANARKFALTFSEATEQPHFHLASFRVNKKIFATLWEKEKRMMLKLSLIDQSVFCTYDTTVFFPVPGGWGTKGATFVSLDKVRADMFKDALKAAYDLAISNRSLKR